MLVFDCLVCDEQNLMSKPLLSRYGVRPYAPARGR